MVLKAVNIISGTTNSLPFSTTCCERAHFHSTGESKGTKKNVVFSPSPKKIIFGLWAVLYITHCLHECFSTHALCYLVDSTPRSPAPIPWISDLEQRLSECSITRLKQIIKQDTEGHGQELAVSH